MEGRLSGQHVSETLFEWLQATGQTGMHIAQVTGMSPTTISNLLNGHIDHPRLSTVRRLAQHFGVSAEAFLEGPTAWELATRSAAEVRTWAQDKVQRDLTNWEKDRDHRHLVEIGHALQIAYDAETRLLQASAHIRDADQWSEVKTARDFYEELVQIVESHSLVVIPEKSDSRRPSEVAQLSTA